MPGLKIMPLRLQFLLLPILSLMACSCAEDPASQDARNERESPKYPHGEIGFRFDHEDAKESEFQGHLLFGPYRDSIPEDATRQRPRIHWPTPIGAYKIEREYAGTTADGDLWSFRITPPTGEQVAVGVLYAGEATVIHETPQYRLHLTPRNIK